MSELLLDEDLCKSTAKEEVRKIARVRTLTVLPRLNGKRKGTVVQFLYEAQLINNGNRIVDLSGADLSEANLSGANLSGANLRDAFLRRADMRAANLGKADLSKAFLVKANLNYANLFKADLNRAYLTLANLSDAKLLGANLSGANLKDAAGITVEGLEQEVTSLQSATMPDGSIHP